MKKLNLVFLFVIVLLFLQCKEDKELLLYDVEQIISDCDGNQMTDSTEIINMIIGTWDLIGYEVGSNSNSNAKPPFIKIVFKDDGTGIIMVDHFQSEMKDYNEFDWYLSPNSSFGASNYFTIKSTPYIGHIRANYFCDQYMYVRPYTTPYVRNLYIKSK